MEGIASSKVYGNLSHAKLDGVFLIPDEVRVAVEKL
jgi:hypothetical protein